MSRRLIVAALPYLGAEERLRREGLSGLTDPFVLAGQDGGALRVVSLNPAAEAAGLAQGMTLADARAVVPSLVTRPATPERLERFIGALIRWATRFSPLVGREVARQDAAGARAAARERPGTAPPARSTGAALVIDATGIAHLFGGEAAMLDALVVELAGLGLTARAGMADSRGAAWALAHYGTDGACPTAIAPPGASRAVIAALPPAALRLDLATAEGLASVGLASIGEMAGVPRGQLARRFGLHVMTRLDQALGVEPEPVAPARSTPPIAARLTLPEPVGLLSDIEAGLDRLLERVCGRLEDAGRGARALRLVARRVDGADVAASIRLARALRDPMRLRALFAPKLAEIDAGFGIDALRLVATQTEPLSYAQPQVATGAEAAAARRQDQLADLLSRLGNRVGMENVTRLVPAESHMPERAFAVAAAGWTAPGDWRAARQGATPPRPLTLFPPEPLAPLPASNAADDPAHRTGAEAAGHEN
ncbi:MAG: DNA polymerase Y family protein, partial [Pseudomonadota bacterium]